MTGTHAPLLAISTLAHLATHSLPVAVQRTNTQWPEISTRAGRCLDWDAFCNLTAQHQGTMAAVLRTVGHKVEAAHRRIPLRNAGPALAVALCRRASSCCQPAVTPGVTVDLRPQQQRCMPPGAMMSCLKLGRPTVARENQGLADKELTASRPGRALSLGSRGRRRQQQQHRRNGSHHPHPVPPL